MRTTRIFTVLVGLLLTVGSFAQKLPENKETKKIEFKESASVDRAGSGDLINRLYFWAQKEFADDDVTILRDDSTFRTLTIKVSRKMVESHFGVNHIHTNRVLKFDLKFDADKKDYTYWINNFEYECVESDRNREEFTISGPLEEFKGPAKRSLNEEIEREINDLVKSFKAGAEIEMTEAQEDEMDKWQDKREDELKAAEEAAKQAAKEAEAARKQAEKEAAAKAKEEAKAQREAEKEAAEAEREAQRAAAEAEREAAKAAREAEIEKARQEREAEKEARQAEIEKERQEREQTQEKPEEEAVPSEDAPADEPQDDPGKE